MKIGNKVKFRFTGEKRLTNGKLVGLVPIKDIVGEKYESKYLERGQEFGYIVEYKTKVRNSIVSDRVGVIEVFEA